MHVVFFGEKYLQHHTIGKLTSKLLKAQNIFKEHIVSHKIFPNYLREEGHVTGSLKGNKKQIKSVRVPVISVNLKFNLPY